MMPRRTFVTIILAALVLPLASLADVPPTPFHCSAHFAARADWLRGLGRATAADRLDRHAALLLEEAEWHRTRPSLRGMIGNDRGLLVPFADAAEPDLSARRDALALDMLTGFVESGHSAAGLPLCQEDRDCLRCTVLLLNALRSWDRLFSEAQR